MNPLDLKLFGGTNLHLEQWLFIKLVKNII